MPLRYKILIVDDEEFNLDILETCISGYTNFLTVSASSGAEALAKLSQHDDIDVVVLDKMMPGMDGLEVLEIMKQDEKLRELPVILQTASAATADVMAGIQAGAYYYLTKPYDKDVLISIIRSALKDRDLYNILHTTDSHENFIARLMDYGKFDFRTPDHARKLARFAAFAFPEPTKAVIGLNELMLNAIEHGNLGISYEEKKFLLKNGTLDDEIERRLANTPDKYATLHLEIHPDKIAVMIEDMGDGFHWNDFLEISPRRVADPNGRGIALAKMISFEDIEFLGSGNQVRCTVHLKEKDSLPKAA